MSIQDKVAALQGKDFKEVLGGLARIMREIITDPVSMRVLVTELERASGGVKKTSAGIVEKQATEENTPKAAPPEVASKEEATAKEEAAKEPKKTTKKAT